MSYLVHFQTANYDFVIIILLMACLNNNNTGSNKKAFFWKHIQIKNIQSLKVNFCDIFCLSKLAL